MLWRALPMVLWEGIHEKGWKIILRLHEKEVRRKLLPWYIPLFILGVCFIPMFIAILRYIVENSQAILETTGDMLMEELTSPFVWYATFGFVFSLLGALIFLAGKKGEDKKLAVYALAFLVIFNAIIIRYTFVRTQFGGKRNHRHHNLQPFPGPDDLSSVAQEKALCGHSPDDSFSVRVYGVWSKGANLLEMPARLSAPGEISDEYVYASVEETGIEGLGDIYITEDQKEELMNLNELANELCADSEICRYDEPAFPL